MRYDHSADQIEDIHNKTENSLTELVEIANEDPDLKGKVIDMLDRISWEFKEANLNLSEQQR